MKFSLKRFLYILKPVCSCIVLLFVAAGCGNRDVSTAEPEKKLQEVFPVSVTKAARETVSQTLEAVGSFLPEEEVTVGTEVAGTVKKLSIDEGSLVKKGDVLLNIDDEKVRIEVQETEAMLREASARLKNSKATFKRIDKLFKDGVVGQNEFDDSQTQVSLNQAVVEKLRAQLRKSKKTLKDTVIVAPIDGVISERLVSTGEYVKVGAELVEIVDTTPLKLVFTLPEKNAGEIKTGQKVDITTRAYIGKNFEGEVYFINPKVDPDTRTIEVKAWVDNSDYKLKPGFYVNVTVMLGERSALVLPESAVSVREGNVIVMVVKNGKVAFKKVTSGLRFNGKVEILDGITDQDDIVVYGRSEITEGTPVKIAPPS